MNPGQIRHLRKTLALTQQQFAELLGVSFVTLNRWENGQSSPPRWGRPSCRRLRVGQAGIWRRRGSPVGGRRLRTSAMRRPGLIFSATRTRCACSSRGAAVLRPSVVSAGSELVVVSIDSLRAPRLFNALRDPQVAPYHLVVLDEAHKLSANRDLDGMFRATDRYRLAEAIAGVRELPEEWRLPWVAHHLLLLTATPHVGKEYPYYSAGAGAVQYRDRVREVSAQVAQALLHPPGQGGNGRPQWQASLSRAPLRHGELLR
jgi:hypothetical protein